MLHIQALGPLNVSGPVGRRVPLVAGEKRLALFLYLLLDGRGGFIRRDLLLPLLWPEADDRHARSALRSLIRDVRNAVGDGVVLSDGDHTLAVDPRRVRCDVLEFESACRNEDWERAVEEYRGPFLQGFGVSGAPGFEEWLERERNRLQLLALDACRGLARDARARGAHDTAVRALRKALRISPYDERVVQELMRTLDAAGDRAGALVAYEEFAARIEKELEVKPGAKTAAVAEGVRREQLRPPAPTHALAADHAPPSGYGEVHGAHAVGQRQTPVPGRARRPRSRRTAALVAAGTVVMLGGTTVVFLLQARASVAPEASVIAVAPFVPTGSDTALARLGRDLVITLSANLDGVGEIHAVDPMAILAQAEGPAEVYTREQAGSVARRLGASSVVHGSLLRTAGGVRLDFGVFTSDSLEELTRGSVTAPATDLTALTDSATWALLRGVWRTRAPPTPNLAAVTTSSITALRAFLDGEQAMFQNRWAAAESAYARSIEQDPTFWLAYQRYTNSKAWLGGWDRTAIERFVRHFDALPERDRECWIAVYPWTAAAARSEPPPPRSLSWHIRDLEAAVGRDPDCWFGLWEYADHMVHRAPLFGNSAADAQITLERFLALMPRVAPAWEHLLWVSQIGGDPAASSRAREALERLEPDAGPGSRLRRRLSDHALHTGQVDTLLADSVARALVSNRQLTWSRGQPGPRVFLEIGLGLPQTAIEIGRRALELGLPRHAAEPLRRDLALAWATRGSWDSALVVLDRLAESDMPGAALDAYQLATVAVWLRALPPHEALARRRAAGASLGRSGAADSAQLWWLDGILAAAEGDEPALATARAALRSVNDSIARLLEVTLEAFSLDLAGDRFRAGEVVARSEWTLTEGQDQARRAVPPAEFVNVVAPAIARAVNRLAASRWLLAGGDTAQAERLLHWHEAIRPAHEWPINATLAALAYLELARIDEARGRSELARANYRQFLRRYDLPVHAHRHLVTEAEAALARLVRAEELHEPE